MVKLFIDKSDILTEVPILNSLISISMFSGKNENCKTYPRVVAMAYNPDGTPKRTVGYWYPDVEAVWTKEMDELDWLGEDGTFGSGNVMRLAYQSKLRALTDKQFDSSL